MVSMRLSGCPREATEWWGERGDMGAGSDVSISFQKLIALIPKALWELLLFALYHLTGGEAGNTR